MQYQQGNINAEQVKDKAQIQQALGTYQYVVIQGQPVIGQPVQQQYQYYPQAQIQYPQQPYAQYYQYPQGVQFTNGFQQQMVMVPQTPIVEGVQTINPIVAKESTLRSYSRYFYGWNVCIGVLALIFLIIRCVTVFQQGEAERAAGVMYIISILFFVIGAIFAIYSISRYLERLLLHYQIFLMLTIVFEIIASIIIFATYDDEKSGNEDKGSYSEGEKGNNRNVGILFFVFSLVVNIVCYGMFIRYARQIRSLMVDLDFTRQNLMNQNHQLVPIQNQGVIYGGAAQF